MAVLDEQKENFIINEPYDDNSLREERKRTGRYVAAGTAIFLSLLGLYQALARGTPEYAALFLPAVIMFIYVLWILYASRTRKKHSFVDISGTDDDTLKEIKSTTPDNQPSSKSNTTTTTTTTKPTTATTPKVFKEHHNFSRSYSVA